MKDLQFKDSKPKLISRAPVCGIRSKRKKEIKVPGWGGCVGGVGGVGGVMVPFATTSLSLRSTWNSCELAHTDDDRDL